MTIVSRSGEAGPFLGDGERVAFPVPFPLEEGSTLSVVLKEPDGEEWTLDPNCFVMSYDAPGVGRAVILRSPPAAGTSIMVLRRLCINQPTSLEADGPLGTLIEAQLDRQVLQTQGLADQLARAPLLPVSSGVRSVRLAAPVPGTVVRWSEDGRVLEPWAGTADIATVAGLGPDILALLRILPVLEAILSQEADIRAVAKAIDAVKELAAMAPDLKAFTANVAKNTTIPDALMPPPLKDEGWSDATSAHRLVSLERNLALVALRQEAASPAGRRGLVDGLVDGFVNGAGLALPTVTTVGPVNMTSNSQGKIAVSASSLGMAPDPAHDPWSSFNGITDPGMNGWIAAEGFPAWLQVDYGATGAVINRYEMDGHFTFSANCRDWIVEGSQDQHSWTQLDRRSDVSDWLTTPRQVFDFPNQSAYRFYRWTILADHGWGGAQIPQLRLSHRSVGTQNAGQDPTTDTVMAIDPTEPWQVVSTSRRARFIPQTAAVLVDLYPGKSSVNADVQASVSRDGGITWTNAVLAERLDLGGGRKIYSAEGVTFHDQPGGSDMMISVAVAGDWAVALHGWSMMWR